LLSAILAALRIKDQTGEGQRVEVTLQRTGVWAMASDVTNALFERAQPVKTSHREPANPIWNFYKTKDGRYLALIMPMALPYWGKFCTMMNRADWATDDRFATLPGMAEHGPSIVPDIEAAFASEDLSVWREKLDASGLIWEPVSELPEVVEDPALRERGAFSVVVHERGGAMEIVSAPFDIRDADIEVRGPAPDRGEHTRVVFREAGMSDEDIETLLARGAIV
jgi:crotonobetainyl-CoA:carnitine CoA-transferase CaiB-like acyl-CoA transferase